MSQTWDEQQLIQAIADKTKIDSASIGLVLKHEQAFMDKLQSGGKADVEVDGDEIVDYVLSQPNVKLNELQIERILDAEMSILQEMGLIEYED